MLENERPFSCSALLYIISNGKTNQNGYIEYTGLLRNKDVSVCGMSALAFYFFWRWEHSGESFPCFKSNKDWYNTKLLIDDLFPVLFFLSILTLLIFFDFSFTKGHLQRAVRHYSTQMVI